MPAPVKEIEIRWRVANSDSPWSYRRYPPDASSITINGLSRNTTYEGEARSLAEGDLASEWVPVTWIMPSSNRDGSTAIPPSVVGNVGSRWVSGTSVTYTTTPTSVTFTVSAGVLQVGDNQINYNGAGASASGTPGSTQTFYLYYDDPRFEGGSRTLGITTDPVASISGYGRIMIVPKTITFPTSGTGGGGGDIGGGGGGTNNPCVSVDTLVIELNKGIIRAGDVEVGDMLLGENYEWERISYSETKRTEGVRLHGSGGATLTCSVSAPIMISQGGAWLAPATFGKYAWIEEIVGRNWVRGQQVVSDIERLGEIEVQHITRNNTFFLASDDGRYWWLHHNLKDMNQV